MKKLIVLGALGLAFASPAVAQHMGLLELIAGIGGSDFLKAAERVDSAPAVRVVRLSTLAGANAAAAARLDEVAVIKADDLEYLRGNLYLNPIAQAVIRNSGVSTEQIVTLQMPGDNAAVLYADDL